MSACPIRRTVLFASAPVFMQSARTRRLRLSPDSTPEELNANFGSIPAQTWLISTGTYIIESSLSARGAPRPRSGGNEVVPVSGGGDFALCVGSGPIAQADSSNTAHATPMLPRMTDSFDPTARRAREVQGLSPPLTAPARREDSDPLISSWCDASSRRTRP